MPFLDAKKLRSRASVDCGAGALSLMFTKVEGKTPLMSGGPGLVVSNTENLRGFGSSVFTKSKNASFASIVGPDGLKKNPFVW